MKKFFLALVAVAVLSSCSSDDSDSTVVNVDPETETPAPGTETPNPGTGSPITGTPQSSDLVGKWLEVATQVDGVWQMAECNQFYSPVTLTYNANGTFTTSSTCQFAGDLAFVSGSYALQGSTVTWYVNEGDDLQHSVSFESSTTMYIAPIYIENGQTVYGDKVKLVKQ